MKVFLSGSSGFIGSWTLRRLIENGYDVRISIREKTNLENINNYLDKIEVLKGDLSDKEFALACVDGCDAVIHTAGKVIPSINPKSNEEVMSSNYVSTHNILFASEQKKVKKFVFLGSIFGLGKGSGREIADESVEFNLKGLMKLIPYVRAKRMSEIIVEEFLKRGLPIVRVYPNFCLGEGDIYLSSSKAIVPFVLGVDFYIEGGINIQWVGDAASSLILALEKGKVGEKYISGGTNLTTYEIGEKVSQILGRNPPRKNINPYIFRAIAKLPYPIISVLDNLFERRMKLDLGSVIISSYGYWFYSDNKARKELGYKSRPAEETLKEAVMYVKKKLMKKIKANEAEGKSVR
ncbi:MAG: NAD-dependent epimerase/dehydratase family protein [Candidatus Calescibacterium sp.]|nr:NAD-dependent epimerase/dehydratase family protein [Candidatus Calescibacterium sp.]MCX7734557.1 NAD-dependent epimerase/dehydratase family protein [bacterium]MDW8087619.1 NAD-dependent epimerase/dehydratase family protein [Candidatus Calescibacterium sp.]